ncbi:serine/threonine-protein phosphatase 2A regulatory subunit B [Nematocida sp. AWRm77]|nr:serine/threonine-protein phosphatase 2A regulatory subunit B [Nematocida sp. AWRm77]
MLWSTWRCRQTITAASADSYKSSLIQDGNLVLGRTKGFLEVYKIDRSLKKRIEFRSHSPCFDYLRSAEISESIDALGIFPSGTREILVLTTNAKTLKLWNVHASYVKKSEDVTVVECCEEPSSTSGESRDEKLSGSVSSPRQKNSPSERLKQIFSCDLTKKTVVTLEKEVSLEDIYNLHSVSVSSCTENVLVSDELSVSFYNPGLSTSWKAVNLKPQRHEELSKIISCARYVEGSSSQFIYGTSSGTLEMHDLRGSTHTTPSLSLPPMESSGFYNEVIRPVSDICFVSDTLIACRNLQCVLLYDVRSPARPLQEYDVYPLVKKKITDLYDSDEIFSKFKLGQHNGKIYTGSFNTAAVEIDTSTHTLTRTFLEPDLEKATRIVDGKKISCVSVDGDCLVATVNNLCHIFRPEKDFDSL